MPERCGVEYRVRTYLRQWVQPTVFTRANAMILDGKLWHVCFAAGEDARYNELVEADFPEAAIAMVKERHEDWRADVPFSISAVRIMFGRVAESDPVNALTHRKGTKFRFHDDRECDYDTIWRPLLRFGARR